MTPIFPKIIAGVFSYSILLSTRLLAHELAVETTGSMSADFRPLAFVAGNGTRCVFLINTGGADSAVDESVAATIGVQKDTSLDKKEAAPWSVPFRFRIGEGTSAKTTSLILDLANVRDDIHEPVHGILGSKLLSQTMLALDFDHHKTHFNKSHLLEQPKTQQIRLQFSDTGLPMIPITVQGNRVLVTIHTGSDVGISLPEQDWERVTAKSNGPVQTEYSRFSNGLESQNNQKYRTLPVEIGTIRIPNELVAMAHDPKSRPSVGLPFLRRFNWVIDFASSTVVIGPSSYFTAPVGDRLGLGLLNTDGKVMVDLVSIGQRGDRLGIKPGDCIARIEGESKVWQSATEIVRYFNYPSVEPVMLTIIRGNQRLQIKLAAE